MTFLSLPGELRNRIYHDLLTGDGVKRAQNLYGSKLHATEWLDTSWVRKPIHPEHTRVFLTCRQIYHEASSVYYHELDLFYSIYTGPWTPSYDATNYLQYTPIPLSIISRLKRLHLRMGAEMEIPKPYLGGAALNLFSVHAKSLESVYILMNFGDGGINQDEVSRQEQIFPSALKDLETVFPSAINGMANLRKLVVEAHGYRDLAECKVQCMGRCIENIVATGGWELVGARCWSDRFCHAYGFYSYYGKWDVSKPGGPLQLSGSGPEFLKRPWWYSGFDWRSME